MNRFLPLRSYSDEGMLLRDVESGIIVTISVVVVVVVVVVAMVVVGCWVVWVKSSSDKDTCVSL